MEICNSWLETQLLEESLPGGLRRPRFSFKNGEKSTAENLKSQNITIVEIAAINRLPSQCQMVCYGFFTSFT